MNRAVGIALIVVGIVLLIYGLNASDSVSSGISRTFTGTPTHKTLWLLIGGAASAVAGAVMTFRPGHR
jgi:uncharacterized membrane protein HdeD (DUF308 family)